jgi:hypothetical protein
MLISYSNALKVTHAHIDMSSTEQASYVKLLTVPLSYGENLSLLAVFTLSIKMFQMCALILEHPVYIVNISDVTIKHITS